MAATEVGQLGISKVIEAELPKNDPWNGIILRKDNPAPQEKEEIPTDEVEEEIETNPEQGEQGEEGGEFEVEGEPIEPAEEKEPNPYFYLSHKLKADGFLPDEFDPTEEVSGIDVYTAYGKKLQKELEPRITKEVYSKLEAQGINQNDIVIARALREGIDVSLLSESTMHERYGSLKEDSSTEEKVSAIKAMYKSRKFSDKEIDNLIRVADEDDDSLDEYFAEAKTFHSNKWKDFRKNEQDRILREEQENQARAASSEKLVRKVLSDKTLYGEKITEEESSSMREAIYNPSDIIEWEGQQYSVTKLYKFNYLFESDPEFKLWLFKKYLFKDNELNTIRKEVDKEKEDDMLKAYELSVKKDLNEKKRKLVNKQLEDKTVQTVDSNTGKKTFYIDLV